MKEIVKDPAKVERILNVATNFFAQNRYQRTKVDQIASEAEVSKGIIFHYFKNKTNLYLATLKHAMQVIDQHADYRVWTEAENMSKLIVEATAYKIKLQMQFPDEFKLLLDAYTNANDFSADFNAKVQKEYGNNMQEPTNLIMPVLERMPIRDDLEIDDVLRMMNGVILQITEESKVFFSEHSVKDLSEMTEIIEHAKTYVDIFERGIMKKID